MGWAMLALIVLLSGGLLWWLGVPRLLWTSVGTALALGAAGYALQGSPWLPSAAPRPTAEEVEVTPDLIALRGAMWGKYTEEAAYEAAFDALLRAGAAESAVKLAIGGVNKYPKSAELWTDLGSAIVAHDRTLSGPARYAFQRAIALAPDHPAPRFFLGMGLIAAGKFDEARAAWVESLARAPANAAYRPQIAERISALDQLMEMARAQQQGQAAR